MSKIVHFALAAKLARHPYILNKVYLLQMPNLIKRYKNICILFLSCRNHPQILILVQIIQLQLVTLLIDLSFKTERHSEYFLVKDTIPSKSAGDACFAFLGDFVFDAERLVPHLVVDDVLAVVDVDVFGEVHDFVLASILFLLINNHKHAAQRLLNISLTLNLDILWLIHYLRQQYPFLNIETIHLFLQLLFSHMRMYF
jgi:hypothetical protein